MKTKSAEVQPEAAPKNTLVAVPLPPGVALSGAKPSRAAKGSKRPLDPREFPAARDSRGSASRTEIRRETPRVSAPRKSNKPAERGSQPRSRKAGKK